jgi:hypothetical protein
MSRGFIRRAFVVLAAPAIGLGMVAVLAGPAQANHVVSISADCYSVVVQFTDFPDSGVPVHISATIAGVGTVSEDTVIDSTTTQATLNISSLTADLAGATANVDVDVTWSYGGSHESQQSIALMCGTATTTSTAQATTTSSTAESTSTSVEGTSVSSSSSTSVPETVTTGGGPATTTLNSTVGPHTSSTPSSRVEAETVSSTAVAVAAASSSLPFTGGSAMPLLFFGICALAAGAALVLGQRRRAARRV